MQQKNLQFVFFGTPEISAETLEILKNNGYLPSLIVTAPDRPKGRKMLLTPPPVKLWAEKNNILCIQPEKLSEDIFNKENYDIAIVVAYGKIFPEWLINLPKYGTLNIHYSLLPKYRGASPVQSAILNAETETGVTIQKMVKELDAGPIIGSEKIQIEHEDTTPILLNKLVKIGGELLVNILPDYISDNIEPAEQNHAEASFCKKIKKEDGLIDLNDDPLKNWSKFKAFYEWPRIYFFNDEKRIIITDAKFEPAQTTIQSGRDGNFVIKKIIPEGGKEIDYRN